MKQRPSTVKKGLVLLLFLLLFTGCSTKRLAFFGTKPTTPAPWPEASSTELEATTPVPEVPASQAVAQQPSVSPSSSMPPPPPAEPPSEEPEPGEWQLILVNSTHLIPEDFSVTLAMTKYGYEVDERIVANLDAMIAAAKQDGVLLLPCSGYRTQERSAQLLQKQIESQMAAGLPYEEAVVEAKRWVAPPGTSDHHTGLAIDIATPLHQVLDHEFANTPAAQWMAKNSIKYGFVIRFPEDKQEITGITYEPWHLRYVGVAHAKAMKEQNLCLEEYVAQIGEAL